MKKDKRSNENDFQRDQSCISRSVTSSRLSGRALIPLPQIKGSALMPHSGNVTAKLGKSANISMEENKRLAQIKEQNLHHSSLHCSGSDLHVPERHSLVYESPSRAAIKVRDGKLKKRNRIDEMAAKKIAEISRSRAMFNRKNDALPEIGQTPVGVSRSSRKLPKIEGARVENNVIDIINKHEPNVLVTSTLKEISQDFMKYSTLGFPTTHPNNAPEVILQNEARVGSAYNGLSYDEYAKMFEHERSRSSAGSRGSRKNN